MLTNSSAKIYFKNIHFHSSLHSKYGESAKCLLEVVQEFQSQTDRVVLSVEQLFDESYTENGIHLTNRALCDIRRKHHSLR